MIAALIISLAVAIIFTSLYIDERASSGGLRTDIETKEATIKRLEEKVSLLEKRLLVNNADSQGEENSLDSRPITVEVLEEAVKFNGFVPQRADEKSVLFKLQGETYWIGCDGTYMMMSKTYTLSKDDPKMELYKEAANRVNDSPYGSAVFRDDSVEFGVGGVEKTYGSLKNNLTAYINLIDIVQNTLSAAIHDLEKERENAQIKSAPIEEPYPGMNPEEQSSSAPLNPLGFEDNKKILS